MIDYLKSLKYPLIILVVIILLSFTRFMEITELTLLDVRYQIRGNLPVDTNIAIIEINDETLKAEGDWRNWQRDKYSILINILHRLQAKAIGFDIFFIDPSKRQLDIGAVTKYLEEKHKDNISLKELKEFAPDYDSLLHKAITNSDITYLSQIFIVTKDTNIENFEKYSFYRKDKTKSLEIQKKFSVPDTIVKYTNIPTASDINPVLSTFSKEAKGIGFAQIIADKDGIVRHYPLLIKYKNRIYPALSLIMALDYLKIPIKNIKIENNKIILDSHRKIPLNNKGLLLINWMGTYYNTYPLIPYIAVKNMSRNLILKELKKTLNKNPNFINDLENFKKTKEYKEIINSFITSKEFTFMVNDLLDILSIAYIFQSFIDEDLNIQYYNIAEQLELPQDNEELNFLFNNIKYHTIILYNKANIQNEKKSIMKRYNISDTSLFNECIRNILEYNITQDDYPYFIYPPDYVEKIGAIYPSFFKNKIFFFGLTASGTHDLNPMPFMPRYPMVGVHANIFNNIISNNFLYQVDNKINILLAIFFFIIITILFTKLKTSKVALIAGSIFFIYLFINFILFQYFNLWVNLLFPSLIIISVFIEKSIENYIKEEKEKRKIKGAFSHYVTPSVVEEILKNPEMLKLGGEKKVCTVFFSDVQSFTSLSEKLSPEKLVEILNKYLTIITDIIMEYNGMLDKYEGDAVMAVFGAPISFPDHPHKACSAAIKIQKELNKMRQEWKKIGWPELYTRIGLNTGEMVAGNMGSSQRFDYTVMGDSVNLGSRLEGANKEYGTYLMISEFTYQYIKDDFITRELDLIRVKGKLKPVKIYELIEEKENASPELLQYVESFHNALQFYKQRNWKKALEEFEKIEKKYPADKSIKLYISRCNNFINTPPPPDWDGVFVFTHK